MNLVGKIFTVIVLVLSLVVASFTVVVYATHKNWRDVVLLPRDKATAEKKVGLVHQLADEREVTEKLKAEKEGLQGELSSVKAERRQAVTKLLEENNALKEEVARLEKAKHELDQSQRKAVATMDATQQTLAALRKEVEGLREEVRAAYKARDEQFAKVVRLTDDFQQAVAEATRLKERQVQLAADLERAKSLLRLHDIDPDGDYRAKPPRVEGLVVAVHGSDLVEISIGSDDGLQKGHRLEVYRVDGVSNPYLGRIEVVRTEPDRSVCKIDPNYRKGVIQKGDRVASKLD